MTGRRVGALVAAVLLPPLGVFLGRGLGRDFWIGTALTILGYIPGVVFALYTLLLREDRDLPDRRLRPGKGVPAAA